MQVYQGLDIGSAKPTIEEQQRVVHYGIDLVSPVENYSAFRFAAYAEPILQETREKGKPLVLCGGTGLYYRALLSGFFTAPDPDPALRASLNERAEKEGGAALLGELSALDPKPLRRSIPTTRGGLSARWRLSTRPGKL